MKSDDELHEIQKKRTKQLKSYGLVGNVAIFVLMITGLWLVNVNNHTPTQPILNHDPQRNDEPDQIDHSIVKENPLESKLTPIADVESLEMVARFPIGEGDKKVGYIPAGLEKLQQGPTSFYYQNGAYYILDNVNQQVVIQREEEISSFKIDGLCWGADIYVSSENEIFVLDSCKRVVYFYDEGGARPRMEHSISENIGNPYEFGLGPDREILIVNADRNYGAIMLENSKRIYGQWFIGSYPTHKVSTSFPDDKTGKIIIDDHTEISIPFRYSVGGILVYDATSNEVIIKKTEVVPDVPIVISESIIQSIGLDGELRGGARIPTEKMTYIPDHMIRVYGGSIYLLSVEDDAVYIYQVHLGKEFESKLLESAIHHLPFSQEEELIWMDFALDTLYFPEFERGEKIVEKTLIDSIAFFIHFRYEGPDRNEMVDWEDQGSIPKEAIDRISEEYLGRKIGKHQSTGGYEYRDGRYYPYGSDNHGYRVPHITDFTDHGDGTYTLEYDLYYAHEGDEKDYLYKVSREEFIEAIHKEPERFSPPIATNKVLLKKVIENNRERYVIIENIKNFFE